MDQRPATSDQRSRGRSDVLTRRESMSRASFASRKSLACRAVASQRRRIASPIIVVLLLASAVAHAAPIPEASIQELRDDFTATSEIESTTQRRLAVKRLVRGAESLLEDHAEAPNRFEVLGVMFQMQKDLLILKNDERNRDAILETGRKLLDAPFEYAAERLEADALLMQLELDREGATEHEHAKAIAELADRYRGTDAEIDSLIMASELAFYLGEAELLKAFRGTLSSRFRESPRAIGFLKDRFASKSSSLMFRGRFKREDGEEIVFPIDRAGHVYVVVFWSQTLNDLKARLTQIKELQEKNPGKFEVFSFNLDELPDAGKGILKSYGLDWKPMHLPGGNNNELFKACGTDPQFLIRIVNAHGYIILTPIDPNPNRFGRRFGPQEYLDITMEKPAFLEMVQSLRVGEFLVGGKGDQHPTSNIQLPTCKSELIRLLGQWNATGEPKYLCEAVKAATAALKSDIPLEEQIVPRFCLAKAALREEGADAEAIVTGFIEKCGGEKASGAAIAAAAILSWDAESPPLFEEYRGKLLDDHMDEPQLWPVTAYFFNKFMMGRLFRGNYYGSHQRIYVGFRAWQQDTEVRPRKFLMKLKGLDGKPVAFPHSDADKVNVVVFMEPAVDKKSGDLQIDFINRLEALSKLHFHTNINYVAAFLKDDTNAVSAIARRNKWPRERVAIVPDGLHNPHVVRLGIFLAGERPNTFVVAPDGTIMWSMSGMYQMAAGANGVVGTVKNMVWNHDVKVGKAALEKGDFAKALRIFAGSFPPERFTPAHIKRAQRLGRARAYMGLDNWPAALKEYDSIMTDHEAASVQRPCPCHSLARKLVARADVLDKLGKKAEAEVDRKRAGYLGCPRSGAARFHADRYEQGVFNRLQGFLQREDWQAAFDYIDDIITQGKDGRQKERVELAGLLRERAEVLAHLGQNEKAAQDRQWADALTTGIAVPADDGEGSQRQQRYVDLVEDSGH